MRGACASVARDVSAVIVLAYLVAVGMRAYQTYDGRPRPLVVGDPFKAKGLRLSGRRTIVLATSSNCQYSRNSLAFHKRLIEAAHRAGVPVTVLTDASSSVPVELTSMLAATDQRVSTKLRAARITGTPTIVLLENEKVLVRWTGQITPVEEKAVISQVDGSVHTLSEVGNKARPIMRVVEVSAATPDPIFSRAPIVDLSPRNASVRSRVARAVNLPFDELSVRMYIELPMDGTPVVLDCTVTEEGACRAHALMMKDSGFTNIWLYDAGALGATCNSTTTP